MKHKKVIRLVQLSMLVALIVVLQLVGTFIKIGPLPMSLVLVPIVVGAFLLGVREGAVLGSVFGIITMIMGIAGMDALSALLWQQNPVIFVILCLLKASACGFGAGLIYKLLNKALGEKRILLTTVMAAASAPIINTGIFVAGMFLFYFDTASNVIPQMWPEVFGTYSGGVEVIFLGLAGFNFVGELLVNLILSPAIVRIIYAIKHTRKTNLENN